RADLDELRARTPKDVRDAEAAADLHELSPRDEHFTPDSERGERQQHRGGVVVHDRGVLRARELVEQPGGVAVTLAALSSDEVVLDAHRSRRIAHRID